MTLIVGGWFVTQKNEAVRFDLNISGQQGMVRVQSSILCSMEVSIEMVRKIVVVVLLFRLIGLMIFM